VELLDNPQLEGKPFAVRLPPILFPIKVMVDERFRLAEGS